MTNEAHSLLNHLCGMPTVGHGTLKRDDLEGLLLETNGQVMAQGRLYDIVSKPIGAGVHRVTLRPWNGGGENDG